MVWAAAMAYSWLFAVFPFFVFLLTLTPYLPFDRGLIVDQVGIALKSSLPHDAAETLILNLADVLNRPRGGLMSTGIILALWAASGGVAMTMSALNICYDVKETRPFYTHRPVAIGLTLIVVILILSILILIPIGSIVTAWVIHWMESKNLPVSTPMLWAWNIARWALALVFMVTAVAIIYHFGPRIKKKFHWITPGSVFTIAMWILLGVVFRFYVDRFGKYDQTYGTVGGVAVLLLVFYLDSLMLLVGAEINSEADYALLSTPLENKETPAEAEAESDVPVGEVGERK